MKRKTIQSLFKQCERQRTVFTIPTYKNISVLWIKSRAEVLQDLRKMKYLKQGGGGGISGGDLPAGTEGGQDAVRDRKFKLPQTGGVWSRISGAEKSLLQIPRHKTDGSATKLEPGLLALPLGLTPIIHL